MRSRPLHPRLINAGSKVASTPASRKAEGPARSAKAEIRESAVAITSNRPGGKRPVVSRRMKRVLMPSPFTELVAWPIRKLLKFWKTIWRAGWYIDVTLVR